MRFDLSNPTLKFFIALLLFLPFNTQANHEKFSIEKFVKMGGEHECANNYEKATSRNMFTRDCMMRSPSKRQLTIVVRAVGKKIDSLDNACEDIQSDLENEIQQRLSELNLATNIISVSTLDFNYSGGKNKPTEVNCTVEIESLQKDVRFKFRYFNESYGSDGFLSRTDENSCQNFVERLKNEKPEILALSGRINDNFTSALSSGCNVFGFEIGQDQVVDGKIKKF